MLHLNNPFENTPQDQMIFFEFILILLIAAIIEILRNGNILFIGYSNLNLKRGPKFWMVSYSKIGLPIYLILLFILNIFVVLERKKKKLRGTVDKKPWKILPLIIS